jgi:hypothetical protein
MTLALIIICLMVLLVVVDETDGSGRESETSETPAEGTDRSGPAAPCFLSVKSIREGDAKEPRRHAWKPVREVETETTPR